MRALITGGSGFIGTNLVDGLLQHGWEILNVDIQEPLKLEHRDSWLEADILEFDVMGNVFDDFQPDTVIHLAARTTTIWSIQKELQQSSMQLKPHHQCQN